MNPDPRFDPNYKGPIQMSAVIGNPKGAPPLTIISGEFADLNGRVLQAGERINVNLLIPYGFREFMKEDHILGKDVIYVGLRSAEAADPFFYNPDV